MTVIAGFTFGGAAALVADVLASGDLDVSGKYVPLATVVDPDRSVWRGLGYSAGLFRKLVLVSPYLCIAWSGGREAAARVVDEMREVLGTGPIAKGLLLEYMDNIHNDEQTAAPSLIILAVCDDGTAEMIGRRVLQVRGLPPDMRAFSGGGGRLDAIDLLVKRGALRETGDAGDIAAGLAPKLVGVFHARESARLRLIPPENPLRFATRYGAGYEVALFRNGKIELDGDTTLLFRDAEWDRDGILNLKPLDLLIRRSYEGGKLRLRVARVRAPARFAVVPHTGQWCVEIPEVTEAAAASPDIIGYLPPAEWPALTSTHEGHVFRIRSERAPLMFLAALRTPMSGEDRTNTIEEKIKDNTVITENDPSVAALALHIQGGLRGPAFRRTLADLRRGRSAGRRPPRSR